MKIGINGRFLNKPFTGIGQYTRYLFKAAAKQNPDDRFVFISPSDVPISVRKDFPDNVKIEIIPEKFSGTAGMKKTFWEQVQVPKFFLKEKVDLAHFPYPSNPWGGFKKTVVVTVHDTIPWTLPEYRKKFLTRLYQNRCKKALWKADQILTVSNSSLQEIKDLCAIPENKIKVIYNSAAPAFETKIPSGQRIMILEKYGIPTDTPFFLYIGGFDERKNVRSIVEVFYRHIFEKFKVNLILAGGKALNSGLYDSFDNLTGWKKRRTLNLNGEIITTGFVDELDLPALYQSSFAFINLSKKEGFNLPLLEAAVSGVPILTSNLPVHHEVVGEYALFCDTDDQKKLAELLKSLLSDSVFYQKQKTKMEHFVNPFSWENSAKELAYLYKKLT